MIGEKKSNYKKERKIIIIVRIVIKIRIILTKITVIQRMISIMAYDKTNTIQLIRITRIMRIMQMVRLII